MTSSEVELDPGPGCGLFLESCAAPEHVIFQYIDSINNRRFELLRSAVFAADAVLEIPGLPPAIGADAVVTLLESMASEVSDVLQLVQGSAVVRDGNRAKGRAYVSEIGRSKDGFDFHVVGVYDDELIDTGAGWRFAHRRFRLLYRSRSESSGKFYQLNPI